MDAKRCKDCVYIATFVVAKPIFNMRKVLKMKKLLMAFVLLFPVTVMGENWIDLYKRGEATYVGGLWAVVSIYCVGARYTDDSGVWASGARTTEDGKCLKQIYHALQGDVNYPEG